MQQQIEDVFKRYRQCKYFGSNSDTETEFTKLIEHIVNQLPEPERDIIKMRYMCREYEYISDYTVYEVKMFISPNTYRKIRNRAIEKLCNMLDLSGD